MKLTLSVVVLLLAACSGQERESVSVECSVDDTLVFAAEDVRSWGVDGGTLYTESLSEGRMVRRMQVNETCRTVAL